MVANLLSHFCPNDVICAVGREVGGTCRPCKNGVALPDFLPAQLGNVVGKCATPSVDRWGRGGTCRLPHRVVHVVHDEVALTRDQVLGDVQVPELSGVDLSVIKTLVEGRDIWRP